MEIQQTKADLKISSDSMHRRQKEVEKRLKDEIKLIKNEMKDGEGRMLSEISKLRNEMQEIKALLIASAKK